MSSNFNAILVLSLLFLASCIFDTDKSYTVTVEAMPTEGGTVFPESSSFSSNEKVTFTAIPKEGWIFLEWIETPFPESWERVESYSRTVTRNFTNTAYFVKAPVVDQTEIVEVTNPLTGRTWMDRNLGAKRVATSSMDFEAMGYLYQWGRGSDGHQIWTSPSVHSNSIFDEPGHDYFLLSTTSKKNDWRIPHNDNLWKGSDGINNPCPTGFSVPTYEEWEEEYLTWPKNRKGGQVAFSSILKLPSTGLRRFDDGKVTSFTLNSGYYWSSSPISKDNDPWYLSFYDSIFRVEVFVSVTTRTSRRANGLAVRCIKDQ